MIPGVGLLSHTTVAPPSAVRETEEEHPVSIVLRDNTLVASAKSVVI